MFSLDQINDVHNRLGKQGTLPQYLQALAAIGVVKYDSFVADGHSAYFDKYGQKIVSLPTHEQLTIANTSNQADFLKHLSLHEQGKTSYLEMSKGLAQSGVEKWTFDTQALTIAYYDRAGDKMLVESIP